MMKNRTLAALTDRQLIRKGDHAVRTGHDLAVEILDCLNEIDRRSLYLEQGYSSLFDWCTRHWCFSPPKAGRYIAAARCLRKYPAVRCMLVDRKLSVCGVSRIAGVLTDENADQLLREVSGKRYIEIEAIVASRRAAPVIREFVRPIGLRVGREKRDESGNLFKPATGNAAPSESDSPMESRSTNQPANHSQIESDSGNGAADPSLDRDQRYEIRFSAGKEFIRKLERAKAICSKLSSLERVIEKALDELLDKHDPERKQARREKRNASNREKKRCAKAGGRALFEKTTPPIGQPKNTTRSGKSRSRHIPEGVKDAVFNRDGGQCTFIGRDGTRCAATAHLQIDHIEPFSRGGKHKLENLRLLCGKHNRLVAVELGLGRGKERLAETGAVWRSEGIPYSQIESGSAIGRGS